MPFHAAGSGRSASATCRFASKGDRRGELRRRPRRSRAARDALLGAVSRARDVRRARLHGGRSHGVGSERAGRIDGPHRPGPGGRVLDPAGREPHGDAWSPHVRLAGCRDGGAAHRGRTRSLGDPRGRAGDRQPVFEGAHVRGRDSEPPSSASATLGGEREFEDALVSGMPPQEPQEHHTERGSESRSATIRIDAPDESRDRVLRSAGRNHRAPRGGRSP